MTSLKFSPLSTVGLRFFHDSLIAIGNRFCGVRATPMSGPSLFSLQMLRSSTTSWSWHSKKEVSSTAALASIRTTVRPCCWFTVLQSRSRKPLPNPPSPAVKRTNEKTVQEWNETIRGLACVPECVGMYSGLDLSRETSTHYMQEMLLQTHLRVAGGSGGAPPSSLAF